MKHRNSARIALMVSLVLSATWSTGCDPTTPNGMACNTDADCPTGQFCGAGGCQLECRVPRDCPSAMTCNSRGQCVLIPDAGAPDGGPVGPCVSDQDCDEDAIYCNGVGRCDASHPLADARGCRIESPCPMGGCVETARSCNYCDASRDHDRDGFDAVDCGGPDCDDANPSINPGRSEFCDAAGVDEDCNVESFGALGEDRDQDGHWPETCCNTRGSITRCGDDCSDDRSVDPHAAQRHRANAEVCDAIDNDCDARVDEGQQVILYRDADGDGQGIGISTPTRTADGSLPTGVAGFAQLGCIAAIPLGWSLQNTDCDDANNRRFRGAPEICGDLVDDNCNGTPRDGCGCIAGDTSPCGGFGLDGSSRVGNVGQCHIGPDAMCSGGTFPMCAPEAVNAATEVCDGLDNDCNGQADESFACVLGRSPARPCTVCDAVGGPLIAGTQTCADGCNYGYCNTAPGVVWSVTDVQGSSYLLSSPYTAPGGTFLRPGFCIEERARDGALRVQGLNPTTCTAVRSDNVRLPSGSYRVGVRVGPNLSEVNPFTDVAFLVTRGSENVANITSHWSTAPGWFYSDAFTARCDAPVSIEVRAVRNGVAPDIVPLLGGFTVFQIQIERL